MLRMPSKSHWSRLESTLQFSVDDITTVTQFVRHVSGEDAYVITASTSPYRYIEIISESDKVFIGLSFDPLPTPGLVISCMSSPQDSSTFDAILQMLRELCKDKGLERIVADPRQTAFRWEGAGFVAVPPSAFDPPIFQTNHLCYYEFHLTNNARQRFEELHGWKEEYFWSPIRPLNWGQRAK